MSNPAKRLLQIIQATKQLNQNQTIPKMNFYAKMFGSNNSWQIIKRLYLATNDLNTIEKYIQSLNNANLYQHPIIQAKTLLTHDCANVNNQSISDSTIMMFSMLADTMPEESQLSEEEQTKFLEEAEKLKSETNNPLISSLIDDMQEAMQLYPYTNHEILLEAAEKVVGRSLLHKEEIEADPIWPKVKENITKFFDLASKAKPLVDIITSITKLLGD